MTQERTPTGATMPASGRLPCGRDTDALVEQIADGAGDRRDAHQQTCPHCQAALAEFERLWAPVRAVSDHRPRAPEGLLDEAAQRHAHPRHPGGEVTRQRHDDPSADPRAAAFALDAPELGVGRDAADAAQRLVEQALGGPRAVV